MQSLRNAVARRCGTWPAALLALLLGSAPAFAQDGAGAPARGTGDPWIDAQLADIDRYAARHRDAFVDELARYHAAPRTVVGEALEAGVAPGDAYYACALAQALGRPCREVLDVRRAYQAQDAAEGRDADWSGVATRLAPERANEARERVKRGIVGSYDRWARPIALDASLRRAFPDRNTPGR